MNPTAFNPNHIYFDPSSMYIMDEPELELCDLEDEAQSYVYPTSDSEEMQLEMQIEDAAPKQIEQALPAIRIDNRCDMLPIKLPNTLLGALCTDLYNNIWPYFPGGSVKEVETSFKNMQMLYGTEYLHQNILLKWIENTNTSLMSMRNVLTEEQMLSYCGQLTCVNLSFDDPKLVSSCYDREILNATLSKLISAANKSKSLSVTSVDPHNFSLISEFAHLEELSISELRFFESFSFFEVHPRINEAVFPLITNLTNLKSLKLDGCHNLTATSLRSIGKLKNLEKLELLNLSMDGIGLVHLKALTSLKEFIVGKNDFTDLQLVDLSADLKHLQIKRR